MSKQIDAAAMRKIGSMIGKELKGLGFALVVFEFKAPGRSNYISNAVREDMVQALFETAYRLKADEDFPTPES